MTNRFTLETGRRLSLAVLAALALVAVPARRRRSPTWVASMMAGFSSACAAAFRSGSLPAPPGEWRAPDGASGARTEVLGTVFTDYGFR